MSTFEISKSQKVSKIIYRIGAPNLPMAAVSEQKRNYSQNDHRDWVRWWNSVNSQEGSPDKNIDFYWADVFPIRTPTVLRAVLVEPKLVDVLCKFALRNFSQYILSTARSFLSGCVTQHADRLQQTVHAGSVISTYLLTKSSAQ